MKEGEEGRGNRRGEEEARRKDEGRRGREERTGGVGGVRRRGAGEGRESKRQK